MNFIKRTVNWTLGIAVVATVALVGVAVVHNIIAPNSVPISTSIAVEKIEPREIKYTEINDGNLIVHYTNGQTDNVGRVVGIDGEGKYPTDGQIDEALSRYCIDGRCDSKAPTSMDIVQALEFYCSESGICAGKDAPAITAEQLAVAVSDYCADGRCVGPAGLSIKGDKGDTADKTAMACVIRNTNNVPTHYVAWKYDLEMNTSYRDLYKLPAWAECSAPIDLTQ